MSQTAWNKGTGGCRRGHNPDRYVAGPSGVSVCLDCKRENGAKYREANKGRLVWQRRARAYGLSVAELDALFNRQRGKCAICRFIFSDGNYHIDHDHKTGKVRGLLCAACNTAIGLFKDSPDLLIQASKYLSHGDGIRNPVTPPTLPPIRVYYQQGSETGN